MPAPGDDLRKHLLVPCPRARLLHTTRTAEPQEAGQQLDPSRFHHFADRKAESSMVVDCPASDTVVSAYASNAVVTNAMDNLMSLDDYLLANQKDQDAFLAKREPASASRSKKAKSKPSTPLQPVAVGARSSKHTILLHEQYQALALPQPVFTYQGDGATKFSVELSFPGLANADELQGLKEKGRFNSKQEAKEAICKSALAILERLVATGRIAKAGKIKKPKNEPVQQSPREKEETAENFVGQLLEFLRATGSPTPIYTDYALGPRWSCTASIEGYPTFGSVDSLFGTKKLARQNAASCAVAHFKDLGTWPTNSTPLGGIKKRKPSSPSSPSPGPHATSNATPASATAQVASLAHMLGLATPEYRFEDPHPEAPDMHSVSVFFRNGGKHAGPIGGVRNIFGKKNAKGECARRALVYLEEVKKERMELAKGFSEEIMGATSVGQREKHQEDDVFEDAVEY